MKTSAPLIASSKVLSAVLEAIYLFHSFIPSVLSSNIIPLESQTNKLALGISYLIRSHAVASPEAPEPRITILTFLISFPYISQAFINAASTTIAVPC